MKKNIKIKSITQYFCDCTYFCTPPQNKGLRLFEIFGFDNDNKKTVSLAFALIKKKLLLLKIF